MIIMIYYKIHEKCVRIRYILYYFVVMFMWCEVMNYAAS